MKRKEKYYRSRVLDIFNELILIDRSTVLEVQEKERKREIKSERERKKKEKERKRGKSDREI